MKSIKLILLTSLAALMTACASNSVTVNFDRNANIKTESYKTFAWLTEAKIIGSTELINHVMKARVDDSIEKAFITKGYSLVDDAEKADFTISYTLGSREEIQVSNYPVTYRGGFSRGRMHYPGYNTYATDTVVRQYTEGKLAIDIFDVKTHQPVFHGWATKRITSDKEESSQAVIDGVVLQVLNQFK